MSQEKKIKDGVLGDNRPLKAKISMFEALVIYVLCGQIGLTKLKL